VSKRFAAKRFESEARGEAGKGRSGEGGEQRNRSRCQASHFTWLEQRQERGGTSQDIELSG